MPRMPVPHLLPAGWYRTVRNTNVGALASEFVLDCLLYCRLLDCVLERSTRTDDQNMPYFVIVSLSSVNCCFLWGWFCASVTRAMQGMCGSAVFAVWQVT